MHTRWELPGETQSKQVPIMSTHYKDIFGVLLNIKGVNKRGRGLDSCLTAEAKTELHCPPLQSLGKEEQRLPSLPVRHSPSPSHLIAKVASPCQPITAVKKPWRNSPDSLFMFLLHIYMWFSSTPFGLFMVFGLSYLPALDREVTFSASLCWGSDSFSKSF